MQFYYSLLLLIALSGIFILIRFFVIHKKNVAVDLFIEALRNENSGNLEAAAAIYERALNEVKKIRFHSQLKIKIIAKLKVLHTVMEYNDGFRFIR